MLGIAYYLAPPIFWILTARIALTGDKKLPLVLSLLWLAGYFAFPMIGMAGPIYFISFQMILIVIMLFVNKHNSNQAGKPANPLDELE